jgi:hypothetical protein
MHLILVTTFGYVGSSIVPTTNVIEFTTAENAQLAVQNINENKFLNKPIMQKAVYLGMK